MPVFLPIAGISTNLLYLVAAGSLVGFLSGLIGVGGGFLLTPILIMIGVSPTIAAASDSNSIVATSACAVGAHFRLGNVDVKLGSILLAGGLVGSAIGVQIIKVLAAFGSANLLIKLAYVVVLGGVGGYMMKDGIRMLRGKPEALATARAGSLPALLEKLPWHVSFPRSGVRHSILLPIVLCTVAGILTAIMGVGGGFLIVPMMIYLLRIPLRLAVGTSLFQILFTCMGVTFMQAVTNQTVDLELALLVAAGSTVGAQFGAQLNQHMRGEHLKVLLAGLALVVSVKMAVGLVVTPASHISHVMVHTP